MASEAGKSADRWGWSRAGVAVLIAATAIPLVLLASDHSVTKPWQQPPELDHDLRRFSDSDPARACPAPAPPMFEGVAVTSLDVTSTGGQTGGFWDTTRRIFYNVVKLLKGDGPQSDSVLVIVAALAAGLAITGYLIIRRHRELMLGIQVLKNACVRPFGLKSVFGALAAIAVLFGAWDYFFIRPDRQDRQALEMLRRLKGKLAISSANGSRTVGVTLRGPQVTDDALRYAARVIGLKSLDVQDAAITDDGLSYVQSMKDLTSLAIYKAPITDKGVRALRSHPRLGSLVLNRTLITDDGLAHLPSLPSLVRLDLSNSQVTDSGMPHLSACARLTHLQLDQCDITDRGLRHLSKLTHLRELHGFGTQITKEGVRELWEDLPTCRVVGVPRPGPNPHPHDSQRPTEE